MHRDASHSVDLQVSVFQQSDWYATLGSGKSCQPHGSVRCWLGFWNRLQLSRTGWCRPLQQLSARMVQSSTKRSAERVCSLSASVAGEPPAAVCVGALRRYLFSNQLVGSVPSALGSLSKLRGLYVGDAPTRTEPESLSRCRRTTHGVQGQRVVHCAPLRAVSRCRRASVDRSPSARLLALQRMNLDRACINMTANRCMPAHAGFAGISTSMRCPGRSPRYLESLSPRRASPPPTQPPTRPCFASTARFYRPDRCLKRTPRDER